MADTTVYRIVVADDFRISRQFFESRIRENERCRLIASFTDADSAAVYCSAHKVDLLVMDVLMFSGADGLTAAERIKADHPSVRIILVTSTAESGWFERAKKAGVESFWYKEYSKESFDEIIDRTLDGESVYPADIPDIDFGKAKIISLTKRDLDVLRELTLGYTNEEIAERLHISVNTVRTHIQNMLNKSGFKNRVELAVQAASLGLVVNGQTCSLLEC